MSPVMTIPEAAMGLTGLRSSPKNRALPGACFHGCRKLCAVEPPVCSGLSPGGALYCV